MHVVDWDSYIVQWGDLIQHLIGHVNVDADLACQRATMARKHRGWPLGTQQRVFFEMKGVPRQNMTLGWQYRV